ncbi:MAG: hypothetical protein HC886_10175 [Leptolyngbyaceae cyanobacterium SM1_1_3]|nr:hypothetical protein [Leptolyngbyaceae cyanobacterium SM1_1_3]
MALSEDCIYYRDRQQTRTQRWVMLGLLGAIGVHGWWPTFAAVAAISLSAVDP